MSDHRLNDQDLDRLIDDVARSMISGEPKRITAASVRSAIDAIPSRRLSVPMWLGFAAAVIVAVLLIPSRGQDSLTRAPAIAAKETPVPQPATLSSPSTTVARGTQTIANTNRASGQHPGRVASSEVNNEPYEGFPRLIIPAIEKPEALTAALTELRLDIAPIDIPPLRVVALDQEQP